MLFRRQTNFQMIHGLTLNLKLGKCFKFTEYVTYLREKQRFTSGLFLEFNLVAHPPATHVYPEEAFFL